MSDNNLDGFQITTIKFADLKLNRPKYVKVDGTHVVIGLIEGKPSGTTDVVAFSALCPHQMGDLSGGGLDEEGIDCPLHFYRFDVRTGACIYPRGEALKLKTYSVRVEGEDILIKIEKPKWQES